MTIAALIGLAILWMLFDKIVGEAPRSRGSLRYQRRKARRLGVDPETVEINPRRHPIAKSEPRRIEIDPRLRTSDIYPEKATGSRAWLWLIVALIVAVIVMENISK